MNSGFKKKLEEAKNNSKRVKLMFQYPGSPRAVKKSGLILDVTDDSFIVDEKYDGECVYSYHYLVEIACEEENGGHVRDQHGSN